MDRIIFLLKNSLSSDDIGAIRSIIEKEGTEVTFIDSGKADISGLISEGTLLVTDNDEDYSDIVDAGSDAMVIVSSEREIDAFPATYFLMDIADVEYDYYERVYRRINDIPWDILETEHLFIRETVESDVDPFARIYADPGMTDYTDPLYDTEKEKKYIREYRDKVYAVQGFGVWTVILKETGEIIGRAGLTSRSGFEGVEVGFVIGRKWQNRGLATEAVRAVSDLGRKELGFDKIYALVAEGNAASVKVLTKCGYSCECRTMAEGREYLMYVMACIE